MDRKYKGIQFKGRLLKTKNIPVAYTTLAIELFDVNTNQWQVLAEVATNPKGVLDFLYTIPTRIAKTDTQNRILKQTIASGGVPSFRWIYQNPKTQQKELIGQSVTIRTEDKKALLIVDFNTLWISDTIQKSSNDITVIATALEPIEATISKEENRELTLHPIDVVAVDRANDMEECQRRVEELNQQIESLSAHTKRLEDLIKNKDAEIQNLKKELEAVNNQNSNEDLEQIIEAQRREIEQLKEDNERQAVHIRDLQKQLENQEHVISNKEEEITSLTTQLSRKDVEIQNLNERIQELENQNPDTHPNKLDAQQVYSSIVHDINRADEAMLNSKFKLANISMNLKATVEKGEEGTLFGLIDYESSKNINGAAISDISIKVIPNDTVTSNTLTVPNIIGLTESAVRNVLQQYDLKLDVIYQPTNVANYIKGQAFKQYPEAGSDLIPGQEVTVIFAKPIQ